MPETGPLEQQIKEIENQILHLRRSNNEIEEALAEEGNDPELRAAIGENIVAIAKREAILEDLRKLAPAAPTLEHSAGISL